MSADQKRPGPGTGFGAGSSARGGPSARGGSGGPSAPGWSGDDRMNELETTMWRSEPVSYTHLTLPTKRIV